MSKPKGQKSTPKREHYTARNKKHKKAMIAAMEKALCIVTTACKIVGIDRSSHYNWLQQDENYKNAIDALEDVVLDFGESHLHKRIKAGSDASTIFFLKCKGRKRGYYEQADDIEDNQDKQGEEFVVRNALYEDE